MTAMDDVPSRAAEQRSSEYVPPAIGDESTDAADGEARGIFNDALRFAEAFLDIAVGVQSVMPAGTDPDEWDDVFQNVVWKAIKTQRRNPECFRTGSAKRWARHVAKNERRDQERSQRRRVIRDEAYLRSLSAGNFHAKPPDEEYEEREADRRVAGALEVVPTKQREAVVDHLAFGYTRAEAAAKHGISERVLKRTVETFRRYARLVLADLRPGNSSAHRRGPAVAKPSIVRGTDHDQRS
jgi:RNA polymerase sigma factor (sigma-70 family)